MFSKKGITLLEILVSIFILSIFMLVSFGSLSRSLIVEKNLHIYNKALEVAQSNFERAMSDKSNQDLNIVETDCFDDDCFKVNIQKTINSNKKMIIVNVFDSKIPKRFEDVTLQSEL
ncbi:type IV pilus modification PilV family protein [Thermodesulfobium narugense]|uniref:type IV pilus modification PilV family protein n=1 Tax=Thermodesulfobium narugense TaxID=184064 RepID=UPI00145F1826|nr:type II secretion system protein [Thermodesulfobium narugense]